MKVRLTQGEKAGDVIEVEDSVGHAFLVSGQAEQPEVEEATEVTVAETPEDPKRSTTPGRKRTAADKPETR